MICGVKIYPGYKHFHANDKRIYKIAELCEKYDKPLIFHQGDVNDPEGNSRLMFAHPIYIDELASKYSKCKIIIAHFGFPYFLETAMIANKNKNVYIDLSGTIDNCGSKNEIRKLRKQYEKDIRRVLIYYPSVKQKLMFGTDYGGEDSTLNQISPYVELVKNLFNKEDQENIFYNTAQKLFF